MKPYIASMTTNKRNIACFLVGYMAYAKDKHTLFKDSVILWSFLIDIAIWFMILMDDYILHHIFIVIEKRVKSWGCGVSPGLCQKNMFYHIWRKGCEGRSIAAALQNAIERLHNDNLPL